MTKENKFFIWEEKNSIEPEKNCSPQPISVPSDTTTKIKNELTPKQCVNIIQIKSGIYKIRNKINGKYYIGSAKNINYRWITHRKLLKSNKHFNRHLQSSWNKHGKETFVFEIVELIPIYKLKETEQLYLNGRDKTLSYNISNDASSPMLGRKHTDETRAKLCIKRKLQKRNPCSDEQKIKQSNTLKELYKNGMKHPLLGTNHSAGETNPMYGKQHSSESKLKMSLSHRGYKTSEETKEKLRAMRGNKTICNLINVRTNECFTGTRQEFIIKYKNGKRNRSIYQLFNGTKSYCGWMLTTNQNNLPLMVLT